MRDGRSALVLLVALAVVAGLWAGPGGIALAEERAAPRASLTGLKAFHRAGQTFVTWKEVEPLVTTERVTWGEIKQARAQAKHPFTYRVYAHAKPIAADTIAQATLVGEVGPLSVYNGNGRNVEYLIAQAMIQCDEMGELARNYNGFITTWHMDHPRMDRYPVPRFVIDEAAGPLPVGTGLYVHHPRAPGRRYYAVVACRDGEANRRDFSPGNALTEPVTETVGPGEPVCQGDGLWGPFFDYPGRRRLYVQWTAPPLSPRPMAFNWSVLVPPNIAGPAPVELYFHGGNYSYAKPNIKFMAGSIQIAPHDYPFSGWYGYHEAWGGGTPLGAGRVHNHTQQRIAAFLEWAKRTWSIDQDRILAVGGDGAAAMALAYPGLFAYAVITGFEGRLLDPKKADQYTAAWGERSPTIKGQHGRGEWAWAELDSVVLAEPGRDLPLFVCKGGSWGRVKGWGRGRGRFYSAMHKAHQPLYAHWAWGGALAAPDKYTGLWRGLDLRRTTPIPAFSNSSLDAEGESSGQTNTVYSWKDDTADTPDGFRITITGRASTVDLTPRRLQQFKIPGGARLRWRAETLPDRQRATAPLQSGEVLADEHGLVTLTGLKLTAGGLVITVTRAT